MYHGVTIHEYTPRIWTQLPLETFRNQLEFLKEQYVPVSLHEVVKAIKENAPLPERAVLVTFDDGLKNNYTVAYQLLQELGVPAAIFLTVDYVGSNEILWFDELFLLLKEVVAHGIVADLDDAAAQSCLQEGRLWESYEILVEKLKRAGPKRRTREMERFKALYSLDRQNLLEDFGLLSWDDVTTMHRSGLVEFGVHTATHRILAELVEDEWEREIVIPKQRLEDQLGDEVAAFSFPNGKPMADFSPIHLERLRLAGYFCAFTTQSALFDYREGDCMAISRIPAGNDATSDSSYFRLNTSGVVCFARELQNGVPVTTMLSPTGTE